jgi:hypothetical protein
MLVGAHLQALVGLLGTADLPRKAPLFSTSVPAFEPGSDVTAESGSLLGDLLCAISGLLDGSNGGIFASLLNLLLGLL